MMAFDGNPRLRALRFFALVLLALGRPPLAGADERQLAFELPVRPGFARHLEILTAPSYALVALDNLRANPLGGRIVVVDAATFRYRMLQASYAGRSGSVFRYEAKIEWNLGVGNAMLPLAIEVDTTRLERGTVSLRVQTPLAAVLPEELVERMRAKAALAADPARQDALLDYLARLEAKAGTAAGPALFELLLRDAYNQSVNVGASVPELGDAEPLSDQALLLATLFIWVVLVPCGLLVAKLRRSRRARAR
jgi:hypothetical protein